MRPLGVGSEYTKEEELVVMHPLEDDTLQKFGFANLD